MDRNLPPDRWWRSNMGTNRRSQLPTTVGPPSGPRENPFTSLPHHFGKHKTFKIPDGTVATGIRIVLLIFRCSAHRADRGVQVIGAEASEKSFGGIDDSTF